MTNLVLFFLLTLIGGLLFLGGTKSQGVAALVLIIIGVLLIVPGVYGLFTSII